MIVVVPAAPPHAGLVYPELAGTELFTPREAARLYAAALRDTLAAAEAAGGQLLVNYLPDGDSETASPDSPATDADATGDAETTTIGDLPAAAEPAIRTLAGETLRDVRDARFERQVGSTASARIGNTVTHLLREEDADSVAVVRPIAPLVRRSMIDGGAMKLRSNGVVLGPTTGGGVYYAGFSEPIDFAGAFGPDELSVLTDRGRDGGSDVAFLRHVPRVDTLAGLRSAVPTIEARVRAERIVPTETAATLHELGVTVRDGELRRE